MMHTRLLATLAAAGRRGNPPRAAMPDRGQELIFDVTEHQAA
jgi:hypothetical protein